MKNIKEFKPLWNLVKEEKGRLIFASSLIFLAQLTEIFQGYLTGRATESITKMNIKMALIYLIVYLFLRLVFDGFVSISASSSLQKIENKISRRLGFNSYKKALDLPAYAYEKTSSGEVINRITQDADTLSFTFGQLLYLVSAIIGSILVLIYIFFNSYIIGLEIIFFMTLLFFILKKYNPMMRDAHKARKNGQDKFSSLTIESVRGIREVKTLGIKNNLISDMLKVIKDVFNKSEKEIDIWRSFNLKTRALKAFMEVSVFITCIILLYYEKTTLTFFIAMTYYVYRFMYLIENINGFSQTYQKVVVSLSRVNELLENRLYKDDEYGEKVLNKAKGVIEFKNVNFAYPDEDLILKNFNLKLEPNKKIAIVGKSGQGKSTLFNLLTRVFDVDDGEILIDGVNIKDLDEKSLRKNISIIRQEPFVFNRTIKQNFKLINKNITLKEIRKYSKIAYLDDYIMSLPKGYDTLLGEGGVNLSGGQKQRLAIARTLAKDTKIILFDEATSALDNNSQNYIKETIDNLVKDHTVVIVAHRLSTIIDADIIYVVDNGKIVASGKHNELLENNKTYKKLYETESLNS